MSKLIVFVILLVASLTSAQLGREKGRCPDFPILQGFVADSYFGLWFEQERYERFFTCDECECVTAEYSPQADGSVRVLNNSTDLETGVKTPVLLRGVISYPDVSPLPGQLNVTFGLEPGTVNYNIVDSDYETYSLVYNCVQVNEEEYDEALWVLSRVPQLNPYPAKLRALVDQISKPEKLRKTNQSEA